MSTAAAAMDRAARGGRSVFAGVTEAGLFAGVLVAVLAFGGTEPLWLAGAEMLLLVLALALVWSREVEARRLVPWPAALLLLLVLAQIVPLPAALFSERTLSVDPHATRTLLVVFTTCVAAFAVARFVCADGERRRRFVLVLVLLGAGEAFYGLGQALTDTQEVFGRPKPYGAEDASGTYVNRNHFAGFLGMVLPFALAMAFTASESAGQRPSVWPRRIFWLFVTAILFLAVAFSKSRMGIFACGVAMVLVAILAVAAPHERKRAAVVALALVVTGAALAVGLGVEPAMERFGALDQEYAEKGRGRWEIWRDTARLIAAQPWLGFGLGAFGVAYTAKQTTYLDWFVHHAHNDYLQVAAELGVPGAALLFGTIFAVTVRALRAARRAHRKNDLPVALGAAGGLTAFLLHSLTDFNLYIPANALILSCVLALACSVAHGSEARSA